MALTLRWVGEADYDRIAETRLRCYAPAGKEIEKYKTWMKDSRAKPGDFVLAEEAGGESVGTATSLSMTMWVRGAALPCQGVAWVGTVRTARRALSRSRGLASTAASGEGSGGGSGVASQIMREVLRKGREREQVVSALMPFRASYYEHFGYGIVERRVQWHLPLSILPEGDCAGFRYMRPDDVPAGLACRQKQVESGQCDIQSISPLFDSEDGFEMVDRPDKAGPVRGWMFLTNEDRDAKRYVRLNDPCYDTRESFVRQLRLLAGMKDQFSGLAVTLPVDLPLNLLLRETQVPHRPVDHPTAVSSVYTRMQVRILDHVRFLQDLKLPDAVGSVRGSAVVAVRESEGAGSRQVSRFRIELEAGRITAKSTDASPDFECSDVTWAAIACGAMTASTAAQWGLITFNRPAALAALDALSVGPAPFCNEYF